MAGNIALTGHDDDFHQSTGADAQMAAMLAFVRAGSTLPVLTFDAGSELTTLLTTLGVSFVNVNPNTALNVTDSLFDHTVYSAFVVASDGSCGGCDNGPTGEANIAAHATAIDNFLNAGGGIIGLAGASSSGYYDFVPQTASSVGGAPSSGYTATGLEGITRLMEMPRTTCSGTLGLTVSHRFTRLPKSTKQRVTEPYRLPQP